ncbi:MAG: hypothetical protein Q4D62_04365 [Planctomycetia bacterium]|nr:hypothetical protein [Planctomycetia bacterium]
MIFWKPMVAVFFVLAGGVGENDVADWVKQLQHSSVATRQAAEEALLQAGPEILPFLPDSASLPPETRLRLNRIRLRLERQQSETTLQNAQVHISQPRTLAEVLSTVEQQTGNRLELGVDGSVEWTPKKTEKEDFWPFVDGLCDALSLQLQPQNEKKGWILLKNRRKTSRHAAQNPRVAYLGPFRMEPTRITSTILLENNTSATRLQVELAWEPRLQPILAQLTWKTLQNAAGEDFSAELLPRVHELPVGMRESRIVAELPLGVKSVETLRQQSQISLGGTLQTVVAGPIFPFTFENLTEKIGREFPPISHRQAEILVTLTGLRREGHSLVATLRYRYEHSHGAMESHRTWVYENPATLEKDSQQIASTRYEMLRQTDHEIALDIYFPWQDDLHGWKLIYPRAVGIYQIEYPFLMKDIPIP